MGTHTDVRIYPTAKIIGLEHITFGRNIQIDDFVFIAATPPSRIGDHVHVASFSSIVGGGTFDIDDFAGLAAGCRIITGSDDFLGGGLTNPTIPDEFRSVTSPTASH